MIATRATRGLDSRLLPVSANVRFSGELGPCLAHDAAAGWPDRPLRAASAERASYGFGAHTVGCAAGPVPDAEVSGMLTRARASIGAVQSGAPLSAEIG